MLAHFRAIPLIISCIICGPRVNLFIIPPTLAPKLPGDLLNQVEDSVLMMILQACVCSSCRLVDVELGDSLMMSRTRSGLLSH